MDNLLECVTIEILMENKKNILVSCIYRAPGSSIDTFSDWVEKNYSILSNKVMFLCGDYNIDLLNPNKRTDIDEFIDVLYSCSLFPIITRPSRITTDSATLIDNIFTNVIDNSIVSGLLINDISDHLPVFLTYDCHLKEKKK